MSRTALIYALLMSALGPAAFARPVETTASVHVSYADLDVTQPAGRASLETRIDRAVSQVCGAHSAYDLAGMSRYQACRRVAWSGARAQLDVIYAGASYAVRAPMTVASQSR